MDLISTINQESCMKYVVVRWKNLENGIQFSNTELFHFLMSIDYDVLDSIFHLHTTDSESAILLKLANEKDVMQLCMDSELLESGFFVNRLIDLNGIRLQVPEREKIAEEELKIIENGISELVENAVFTIFGSYNSKVRRNGFSDIDLAVSSRSSDRTDVRPVDMIIENPKCLLEHPLSHAEFYSYPPEEVIRAIYKCFLDNEVFQNRFKMRAHLVETPIVMLDSTKVPEMKKFHVKGDTEVSKKGDLPIASTANKVQESPEDKKISQQGSVKKETSVQNPEFKKDDGKSQRTEKNEKNKKPLISVEPFGDLTFKVESESQIRLTFKNISEEKIMFKIKVSDQAYTSFVFSVNPVFGTLEAGESSDVVVTHFSSPCKEAKLVTVNSKYVGEIDLAKSFRNAKPTGGPVTINLIAN
ncbi:Protein CBG05789 [Caenorhabditis briggsae]|uniref:Major sperm protein n=1 Tax=Caenorhabditis briggsae TaxID=6238 RepID=A8X1M4_CAEBR|nr:Protein CBG05789 [Caenorhabditis briggsae]CAP26534.1 Protein CBG05789 [Caenorhabditis briggsae]